MTKLPVRLKNFLSYTGVLSRVGFVLVGIGIFLALVSYAKGIQILIFVPALVLALFCYSYWEIIQIKKRIRVFWIHEKDTYSIIIRGEWIRDFCFRVGISNEKWIVMLIPENRGMRFAIPAEKSGGIVVFFTGSFDILRYVTPLIGIEHRNDDGDTAIQAEDADENFFIFVKPFETGDRTNRMDSIKSSIKNFPFVKTIEQYVSGDQRKKSNPEERIISIESTLPLERKNDLKRADAIHILFILLNFTVIFVHWNNVWMSGFLLATIGIVALLKKSVKIPENRIVWYRNSSLIFLFLTMLVFTKIEGNMGLPGSIFLTQILIIKKLFPDNREDGFLYIFLSLFVFVAVAITSTALWFILFFLVYLILAILLLSTVSGYGFNEPINSSVGTRVRTFSYFRSLIAILVMMVGWFFIIPHGEAIERNSTFTSQKPTETRSGFGNEINLQNVANIKKDLSKKIVVGNLTENQAEFFKTYYWRGDRYTEFHGKKWEKPGFIAQKNIVISPTGIANIHGGKWNRENQNYDAGSGMTLTESEILDTYRVTYYTTGTKNLFFPKTPENFNFIDRSIHTNLYVTQNDNSLYSISPSPNEPIILDISIKRSKNTNQLIDAHSTFVPFQIRIDSETEALFQTFWDSIDPKLRNSPSWLAWYIKYRAGFSYSIIDPAPSLESFLYGTKQGHCEYFATVLTLTLQHFGYQATIVNGFYGGEWNRLAQALVIQWQHAHAWTEVYDKKKNKWIVLDATPNQVSPPIAFSLKNLQQSFMETYDYLDINWYTYVANFSRTAQKELFLKILPYVPMVFSIAFLILARRLLWNGYRKIWEFLSEDYETKLIRFLGGTKKSKFVLRTYQNLQPELVKNTRKTIYSQQRISRLEYKKLITEWKATFAKNE